MTEAELRLWAERSDHPLARWLRWKGGGIFLPPRSLPRPYWGSPSQPGNCLGTSIGVAQRYRLRIMVGFAVPEADQTPRPHVWNTDSEGVVDVTWHPVGPASAYLGIEPTRLELAALSALNFDSIAAAHAT